MAKVFISGASGGFGREFAIQLEAMGYDLILHGRDRVRLQLTLDALQHPKKHLCLIADLAIPEEVEQLISRLRQEDELIALVNNAGFGVWGRFVERESVLQQEVLQTDLMAPMHMSHALLPALLKRKGFMINVSSLAAETPLPCLASYAAAKAGLTFWSEALRTELAEKLRVVTLAPGPSPTGFRDRSGMVAGKGSFFRTSAGEVVSQALQCLEQGGGYCIPGWRHKLLFVIQCLTPRCLSLKLMYKYLRL
ncbi:MAG: SDR family NAD(P)-dependent oxidoreductase [Mariprofundaceae bacterium]|nr:SDR family NAD(P)-dependent oxidoreductase [Mariprofundaceae bacterium]